MAFGILGVGHSVPDRVLSNSDIEKLVETSNDWIISRTGIQERRIADPGSGTSRWASEAARRALAGSGVHPADIELLVVGTTTPDMPLPACSCLVQKELGLGPIPAFDVSAACAGFVYALACAHRFLLSGGMRKALVIGADQISPYIDWKDRSTCVLFGDGAGACVLGETRGRGIIKIILGADGRFADLIKIPSGGSMSAASAQTVANGGHYLKMNGTEVFKHAVKTMAQSIQDLLASENLCPEDIACIIPHQANMRIVDAVTERVGCAKEKIFINLEKYGNTSAASVILALSEAAASGRVKKGDLVVLTTFGAGLVWGSVLLEWEGSR